MGEKIYAPFTTEQVSRLNEFQQLESLHPFTCASGNRTDEAHRNYQAEHGGDYGQLVATEDGWICPSCPYRQSWALAFMADPEAIKTIRQAAKALSM